MAISPLVRSLLASTPLGAGLLFATPAQAKKPAKPEAASAVPKIALTVGVKGGPSGNILLEPDNGPIGYAAPFEEGAGGWGGGGGLFGELRVLRGHLGVETGLYVDYARNKSKITYNSVVETEWGWGITFLRIPLLLNGGTAGKGGKPRFAFGIGPEFVIPVASKPLFEITEGAQYVPDEGAFTDGFTLRTKPQVGLTVNPALSIPAGPLRVTIDLRYVVFFDVPDEYDDRVTANVSNVNRPTFDVLAKYNMDLHILLGLGYDFGFGK